MKKDRVQLTQPPSKEEWMKRVSRELTFHSCLLQVVLDRTEELKDVPKVYHHEVKQTGNRFLSAIDSKLNTIYPDCDNDEIDQGMNLINLIKDKLDECWQIYCKEIEKHD